MNTGPIKNSKPKEHSCPDHLIAGHVGTVGQITLGEPVKDIVKHVASASSTSPAVNQGLVKAEHLSSTTPGFMSHVSDKSESQSSRAHLRRSSTMKPSCACHSPNDNPLGKIGELDDDHADLVNAALSVHSAQEKACSDLFWKEMDSFFAPVTPKDQLLLKSALQCVEELNQGLPQVVDDDEYQALLECVEELNQGPPQVVADDESQALDVLKQDCLSGGEEISLDKQSASCFVGLETSKLSNAVPSLFQRVMSALIVDDESKDLDNPSEGRNVPFLNADDQNDASSSQVNMPPVTSFNCQYQINSVDERLLQELHNIGLHLETTDSEDKEEWIDQELKKLEEKHCQQAAKVKGFLDRIDKAIQSGQDLDKRNPVELAMDQLITIAYQKIMGGRRRWYARRAYPKLPKRAGLALIKRTLARCKEFEETGRSCFDEPNLQQILSSAPPPGKDAEPVHRNGLRTGGSICVQHSSMASTGGRQALDHSLKGKNVTSNQGGHKEEGGTRNGGGKRKMAARNSNGKQKQKMADRTNTAATSNLLENRLGTENVTETSKEEFSYAHPRADEPNDPIANFENNLMKVEEFASPANVSDNLAEASGLIDSAQLDALAPINSYPSSNFCGTLDDLDDILMFF